MSERSEEDIRVLVVDDEPLLLELAREFLGGIHGFDVDTERAPAKALDRLLVDRFDVVVSDYQMPSMDGIVFLKTLRKRGDDVPFILLTGKGREEVAMDALNNGANFYLQKGAQAGPQFAELSNMVRRSVHQKRAERAIRDSENKYWRLFNSTKDAVLLQTGQALEAPLVDVNERTCSMLGYSKDELLSIDGRKLVTPDTLREAPGHYEMLCKEGASTTVLTLVSKGGELIPCEVTTTLVKLSDIDCALTVARDLRETRRFDMVVKEGEARFRAMFEHSATGIALEDSDRRILECNTALARILGRDRDELVGSIAYPLMDPAYAAEDKKDFQRLWRGELEHYTRENLYRGADGSAIWANVHFSLLHDRGRVMALGMVEDITARKRAERLQDALYRISQATSSPSGLDGLYTTIHRILGELMPAVNFYICLVDEEDDMLTYPYQVDERDPNHGRVKRGRTISDYMIRKGEAILLGPEKIARLIDEECLEIIGTRPIDWMGSPLKVGDRVIGAMVVQSYTEGMRYKETDLEVLQFVSDQVAMAIERKRSAEALKESQRTMMTLMANLPGMAYRCKLDDEWTMEFISEGCRTATGYDPMELIDGRHLSYNEIIHPDDREMVREEVLAGVEREDQYHIEYRLLAKDGLTRWMWEQGCAVRGPGGDVVALEGFISDVTDRRNAEERAELANRKLKLLEELTRHDMMNRIAMLSGYLELAKKNVTDEKVTSYLDKAMQATRTMGEHMEFTREYQRLGTVEPSWFDMQEVAGWAVSKTDLGDLAVEVELEGLSIYADPMIERVFSNLIENSVKHGKKARKVSLTYHQDGEEAVIVFQDDGIGIPDGSKERIFERAYMHRLGHGMHFVQEVLLITGLRVEEVGTEGRGAVFRIRVPVGRYQVSSGSEDKGICP